MLQVEETVSEVVRESFWQQEEPPYRELLRLEHEPVLEVFSQSQLTAGFAHLPTQLVCVDERVRTNDPETAEIALLGCGALFTLEERALVAREIHKLGIPIDTVCHHDYCRAVARYCEIVEQRDGVIIDVRTAGRQTALAMLKALDREKDIRRIGYDRAADKTMTGHPMFHHARVIVVDGTGRINPPALGLPTAFQYSARYIPNVDLMNADLALIQDVALTLGYGDWFRSRAPLILLLVGDPNPKDWTWSTTMLEVNLNRSLAKYPLHTKILRLNLPVDSYP